MSSRTSTNSSAKRQTSRVGRRQFLRAAGATGILGLAGCTGGSDGETTTTADGGSGNDNGGTTTTSGGSGPTASLTVARGSEGTATAAMSVGWAELIKEYTDDRITMSLQSSGGTIASTRLVGNGEVDIGHVQASSQELAYRAMEPFTEEITNVTILFNDFVAVNPFAYTLTGNDIDYLEDLPGTRMAFGPPGSSPGPSLIQYLEANGLWEDNPIEQLQVSYPEGSGLVTSQRVDACVGYTINHSLASWTDEFITRNDDAKMVPPQSEANIQKFLDDSLGTTLFMLNPQELRHAWENSAVADKTEIPTVGQPGAWVASTALPEDVAYEITKVAIEHRSELPEYHNLWTAFADDPEGIGLLYKSETAPYHAGAIRAYEEAGFDVSGVTVAE